MDARTMFNPVLHHDAFVLLHNILSRLPPPAHSPKSVFALAILLHQLRPPRYLFLSLLHGP